MWFSVSVRDNNCHPVSCLATFWPETKKIWGLIPPPGLGVHSKWYNWNKPLFWVVTTKQTNKPKLLIMVGLSFVTTLALRLAALRTRRPTVPTLKATKTHKINSRFRSKARQLQSCMWLWKPRSRVSNPLHEKDFFNCRTENNAGLERFSSGRSAQAAELRESIIWFAVYYYPACRQNVISK